MPIREYRCSKGHITEEIVLAGDKTPKTVKCKRCGKRGRFVPLSICAFHLIGDWNSGAHQKESRGNRWERLRRDHARCDDEDIASFYE